MNPAVYHIVSGDAFLTGNVLLIIAAGTLGCANRTEARLSVFGTLFGVLLIVLSAAPFGILYYVALIFASGAVLRAASRRSRNPFETCVVIAIVAVTLFGIVSDISCRMPIQFDEQVPRHVTIFADSVTAGIGENEAVTWPQLLAAQHGVRVDNRAKMGANVGSQLKDLDVHSIEPGLILIELGGNDIFGSTTPEQFHERLDEFLGRLSATGQPIVMLELPVPPTFNRFGRSQHLLAKKHHIHLIHKRVFASILAGPGATLDTIHLSQKGHDLMAKRIWSVISRAF